MQGLYVYSTCVRGKDIGRKRRAQINDKTKQGLENGVQWGGAMETNVRQTPFLILRLVRQRSALYGCQIIRCHDRFKIVQQGCVGFLIRL